MSETPEPATRAVPWTPPLPAEIPALHASMQKWVVDPLLLTITCQALHAGQGTIIPATEDVMEAALILHTEEADRLEAAQLFVVDADTTEDALAAGATLPDWAVTPEDLPAPEGLMVFDIPIGYNAGLAGVPLPVVACSWGPSPYCAPSTGGVWLTFWAVGNRAPLIAEAIGNGATPEDARHGIEVGTPPLLRADEALICWSATGVPEFVPTERRFATDDLTGVLAHQDAAPWLQTVLAAWNFIQQRVAEERAPRAQRRRAQREGRPLSPVRVVSIHRRVSGSPPAEPTGRAVGVRFPVRGFWRQQPHGVGRSLRKRTWIKRHWRGPEDAPVQIRHTVTVVETPPEQHE